MTRQERLRHMKEGKTILRARRQPKSGKWEIVTYTGSSFMVYSFDKFNTRGECEDFITNTVNHQPGLFICDFSIEGEQKRDVSVEWSDPQNDNINVPDELMPLFQGIGTQLRLHTASGKNEILTVAHILRKAELFFHKMYTGKEAVTT